MTGRRSSQSFRSFRIRARITAPERFELRLALFGHGFIDLPPHRWDSGNERLSTVVDLGGRAVEIELAQRKGELLVGVLGAISTSERERLRALVRRMLRLDEDLSDFWSLCSELPRLSWVARRGGGRLLRSATVFEDIIKLLFTTNCSWSATRGMVSRLVEALGNESRSGARAFPSPERCAEKSARFYRDVVRAGYRAPFVVEIARGFASGRLTANSFEDASLPVDALRSRLLELPGFGPYAAGQALRLLGHYCDLALDSWCRARLAAARGDGRAPSERHVEREYARFGSYRGLALWMDLTAPWHGEAPVTGRAPRPLRAQG